VKKSNERKKSNAGKGTSPNGKPSRITFTRFDHLLLHYFDALHLQFYCIIATASKALGWYC
jgi:hypothetical protein